MKPGETDAARLSLPFPRWLTLFTGILVGTTFLYLAARNIDLDEAIAIIYSMDVVWLLPFTLAWLIVLLLRGVRWRLMFSDNSRPTVRHTLDGVIIGKAANNLMPARLGEFVRASVIGRLYPDTGMTGCVATIVVEKVLDTFMILALMGLAFLLAPLPEWIVRAGISLIFLFSILLAALWIIGRAKMAHESSSERPASFTRRVVSFASDMMLKFSSGLHSLRSLQHFVPVVFLTSLIWGLEVLLIFLLMQAFSIEAPYMAAVVSIVFLCIGGMLPAAPGFIGTYQLFIVGGMHLYGVPETEAFALSIFMNLFAFVIPFLLVLVIVVREKGVINIRQIFGTVSTAK